MTKTIGAGERVQKFLTRLVVNHQTIFEKFNSQTVVISGATGLIGSQLSLCFLIYNQLFDGNIHVLGLIRNEAKAQKIFGDFYSSMAFIKSDIRNLTTIAESVDYIFHTAAITQSQMMIEKPVDTLDTMYQGTKNLLEIARLQKSKFIYMSSMEAFGITDPKLPLVRETDLGYIDLTNVRSTYSEGKRVCELLTTAYAHQYELATFNVRLAQTFGPGSDQADARVFAYFANAALAGKDILIKSSGESMGNYVDVRDAINAILTVSQLGEIGETYTVVNEKSTMTIRNLAELVATRFSAGQSNIMIQNNSQEKKKFAPDTPMRLSSSKLRSLGWSPEYAITDMFDDMIKSWN
ncbi:NAD(P)-dependent oxidoreductase [Leuconostoc lactis]|uniref:NAD-dependent epimerase/dehydratase family protein n=1 Tax=Leuconostoc lactis TaxID=1246 RepID=UPI001D10151E|nr:NAD(P)-dependent oxidoreductase [Leuconostoc lactis]MCC2744906.1 NAD(P)-dependent oxidoreductase [Leuconostoc lactis]MCC2755444.1 NAD(P)-dependent oxidoreductase [Leuconostoc lactis]